MTRIALIAAFGAAGALARYGVSSAIHVRDLPVATFLVNVTGSFVLGVLVTWGAARLAGDLHAALVVGFLGAYTTFSTFTVDVTLLADDGRAGAATLYVVASVAVGIAAAAAGVAFGRSVLAR